MFLEIPVGERLLGLHLVPPMLVVLAVLLTLGLGLTNGSAFVSDEQRSPLATLGLLALTAVSSAVSFLQILSRMELFRTPRHPIGRLATFLGIEVTMLLFVGLALAWQLRPSRPMPSTGRLGALGSAILLGIVLPPLHILALQPFERVPLLEPDGPPVMHTGLSRQLTARQEEREVGPWWFSETEIDGTEVGTQQVWLRAQGGLLRVRRKVDIQVGEERGDRRLPIAVGNRWTWSGTTNSSAQLFLIVPTRGSSSGYLSQLEIEGIEEHHGTRWFRASVASTTPPNQSEGTPGETERHQLWIAGVDGQLMTWDGEDGYSFLLADAEAPELDEATPRDSSGCTVSWLRGARCVCSPTPPAELPLAAPRYCRVSRRAGGGSAVVAVFTLGIVIPGGSTTHWRLMESQPGSGPAMPM